MSLFWLNGDIRSPVLGIPHATPTERRMKSFPITGLYSESLDAVWDPNIDELKVSIAGVESAITLNVDSIDFAALGSPADEAWDGEALEAGSIGIQKGMFLSLAEIWSRLGDVWTRLADGSAKAGLVAGTADIGKVGMQQQLVIDAVIPINTASSAAVDLGTARAALLIMPAAWTAADLTFEVSHDGATFVPLHESGGDEKVVKAVQGRGVLLSLADFVGIRHLKIRSGTTALPVNQAAARTIKILAQP